MSSRGDKLPGCSIVCCPRNFVSDCFTNRFSFWHEYWIKDCAISRSMTPGLSVLRVSVCRVRCAMHVSCRRWHPARGDARSLRTPAVIPPGYFCQPGFRPACLGFSAGVGLLLRGCYPSCSTATWMACQQLDYCKNEARILPDKKCVTGWNP